jgi:hypothetical protein
VKKTTLYLTVDGKSVINFAPRIFGDIEHVLEKLGNRVNTHSILVDISSFRGVGGIFSIGSCDGLLDHTRVLDILSDQSGVILLQPGEVLNFNVSDNQTIRLYNKPEKNGPYLHYGIFKGKIHRYLDRELRNIRNGVLLSADRA